MAEIDADVIGTSEVDLDGRRASVRTGSSNQGNLHADALRATAANLAGDFGTPAPDVAIQNGGGIRNDAVIPAGAHHRRRHLGHRPVPQLRGGGRGSP